MLTASETWVMPVTLAGRHATLEPLTEAHAPLLAGLCDASTFRFFSICPPSFDQAGMLAYVRAMLEMERTVAFAILDGRTLRPVGVTAYGDIRAQHRGLEIGWTWLTHAARGTRINPQAKRLLLGHAYEALGAQRVQLKTDSRNLHSQAAIAKLGATREGVLRRHMVMHDGYVRDTVMFSITGEEWPGVRAGLDSRLDDPIS